mgnify:CR=1 FL=1
MDYLPEFILKIKYDTDNAFPVKNHHKEIVLSIRNNIKILFIFSNFFGFFGLASLALSYRSL